MKKNRKYETFVLVIFLASAFLMATGCAPPPEKESKGVLFGPYQCKCNEEHIVFTAGVMRRIDFNGTDNCEGTDSEFIYPDGTKYIIKDGQSSGSSTSLNTGEALKFKCNGTSGSCSYSYSLNN